MKVWEKLSQVNVDNKEKYMGLFSGIVKQIIDNKYEFKEGIEEKEFCYIVNEKNRLNSLFVHIVPKDLFKLFREMQEKAPNEFLGFSVLVGKKENMDIRVSCFGIPCNLLAKTLTNSGKVNLENEK